MDTIKDKELSVLDFMPARPTGEEITAHAGVPLCDHTSVASKDMVIEGLRTVYDPEIPVNIYELGLIYDVNVAENAKIDLVMTLTSPHCPVAEILPAQVKSRVELVHGVNEVELELTWEPPWDPEMMSEAAKLECGFM